MLSKSSDLASKSKAKDLSGTLTCKIHELEKQIQADRAIAIQEKIEKNRKMLENHISQHLSGLLSKDDDLLKERKGSGGMLSARIENPLSKFKELFQGSGEKDYIISQEVASFTSTKLPAVEKIPSYTTWIFLDRNQRMAEDQSVVGRRRIYYEKHGSEALICSDSEEETVEPEEEKHEFSEAEDRILWMVSEEHGLSEEVLNILTESIGGTDSEIRERYNTLKEKFQETHDLVKSPIPDKTYLDKGLSATLDSFDNLFCRRCLVFDCRLHGCSQTQIEPGEKQYYSSESEEDGKPCSEQCYLLLRLVKDASLKNESKISEEGCQTSISLNASVLAHSESKGKRKVDNETDTDLALVHDDPQVSSTKKQKTSSGDETLSLPTKDIPPLDDISSSITEDVTADVNLMMISTKENTTNESETLGLKKASSSITEQVKRVLNNHEWKPLEKELYSKGVEIFGRNSCLIARNLLCGLKTCMEVSSYMYDDRAAMSRGAFDTSSSFSDDDGKADADRLGRDSSARSRLFRRRGKTRKLKYSWKSAGHPPIWRRIADENQSCKQYIPCGCQSMCGKQCPCQLNMTCCEKYCGCSKSCKNRFRGCHCAKSQCRSRQCPCFAAGRECDPDVCRNCWVSCGDGSLGEPPRKGDGQCGNMRLLLRQQQRIMLAKSDVAGWGAFLKNSVNKNDYLGEYTGELISHREADKRGKIYDRANSSFLFDLNDQYVLDAYRKGDKLKFANHSSNPNCYAKVMLVAGDHRVGIFANERIEASEELFYDYRYGPDQAPIWARKPDGSKGSDDFPVPQGRAKKHQSHS
jgi:histone-lysine N-methyltransferase EZH2